MKTYDCIIIGSGPGGISAAIYLKRDGVNVCLFEGNVPGGAIVNTEVINNYPGFSSISGADLAMNMLNQISELNIDVYYEQAKIEKYNDLYKVNDCSAKYVIIATGTKVKTLGLESENKFLYRGISWCATCDGFLYKDKDVAVAGGGDSALSSAMTLSRYASIVYLIHRRSEFRAKESLVNDVKNTKNIKLVLDSNIVELYGDKKLEGIKVKNNLNNEISDIKIACLFEEIGRIPNSDVIDGLEKDSNGYILVNESFETNIPNIYAIGDVISKSVRQIVTATSDGAVAAIAISRKVK